MSTVNEMLRVNGFFTFSRIMRIQGESDLQSYTDAVPTEFSSLPRERQRTGSSSLPQFNREPALIDNNMVLISGFTKYIITGNENSEYLQVFVELHVPKGLRVHYICPIYLALYNKSDRNELIEVIIVSDGRHKVVSGRTNARTLAVGVHSFLFQSPLVCRLWYVLINDVKSATISRLNELLDLHDKRAPRGYRTHFAELECSLPSTNAPTHQTTAQVFKRPSILSEALSCIDYLSSRLEHCRCSNNVSLEMEDTVYDTRAKLSKLIAQSSYTTLYFITPKECLSLE